ncbi:unnamed protein product, partial [Hapterophycus canaliculatus]
SGGGSTSVRRCLASIGVDAARDLSRCSSLTEEFTAIKRAYFRKILVVHPDKGGDAAEFRDVNSSWELIRKLYEDRAVGSFADAASAPAQDRYDYDYAQKDSGSRGGGGSGRASSTPRTHMPWQYYYDAAAEDVPPYKVELARSGRSKCRGTKAARKCSAEDPLIGKGEIRIGSLDEQAGTYSRWIHLECWRVPSRIWLGLAQEGGAGCGSLEQCVAALSSMNEIQFTGFNDLSEHDRRKIASHAMNKANWAKLQGRRAVTTSRAGGGGAARPRPHAAAGGSSASSAGGGASSVPPTSGAVQSLVGHQEDAATTTAMVAPPAARSGFYVVPRPGVNGAPRDFLKGKTIVMTGLFPEIGGGTGLNLGKDRLRSMCESFGARVTSSISGKTDMLIVGKEPGASKVSKGSASAKCQLLSLADLTLSIQGEQQLETAPPPEIEAFSAGYSGNGILNKLGNGGARRLLQAAQAPKPAREEGGTEPGPKSAKKRAPATKKRAPATKKRASAAKARPATKAKAKPGPKAKTPAAAKKTAAGVKRKKEEKEEGEGVGRAPAKKRKGRPRSRKKGEETALALVA